MIRKKGLLDRVTDRNVHEIIASNAVFADQRALATVSKELNRAVNATLVRQTRYVLQPAEVLILLDKLEKGGASKVVGLSIQGKGLMRTESVNGFPNLESLKIGYESLEEEEMESRGLDPDQTYVEDYQFKPGQEIGPRFENYGQCRTGLVGPMDMMFLPKLTHLDIDGRSLCSKGNWMTELAAMLRAMPKLSTITMRNFEMHWDTQSSNPWLRWVTKGERFLKWIQESDKIGESSNTVMRMVTEAVRVSASGLRSFKWKMTSKDPKAWIPIEYELHQLFEHLHASPRPFDLHLFGGMLRTSESLALLWNSREQDSKVMLFTDKDTDTQLQLGLEQIEAPQYADMLINWQDEMIV